MVYVDDIVINKRVSGDDMANKVIFLDFDGPMIPIRAYWLPTQTKPFVSTFDPVAVSLINKLILDSGAKVVISSTWRTKGFDAVVELLTRNGVGPSNLHEDWATPAKLTSQRIHEIKWWLDDHPETTHYVAIDDETLDIDFVPNAVQADTYEGFSLRNYLEARAFLDAYSESQGREKAEHKTLIDHLKRTAVWHMKRKGEADQWKTREAIEILFSEDEKEDTNADL